MSWLKTLRQFLVLFMFLALFLGVLHGCLNLLGKSQQYTRIDDSVLNKINDSIYLTKYSDKIVFKKDVKNNLESQDLAPEIANMTYFLFDSMDLKTELKSASERSECLFLDFKIPDETQEELDKIISVLDFKNCVFFQTPYLKMQSYFSFKKPRWFFNLMEVDLQKSRFLSSLGLESLSTLKGDFIVLGTPETKISNRLLNEIKRRDIIIFIKSDF
jgi:hypothetical protein